MNILFALTLSLPMNNAVQTAVPSSMYASETPCPAPCAVESDLFRFIRKETVVPASRSEVYAAWTTLEGVTSFFAPEAKVELRPGGAYEMYFLRDNPPGSRGGEGLTILAYRPDEYVAFTWNAPPTMPRVRGQHTVTVVQFREVGPNATAIELFQTGWGEGSEWDEAFRYFESAWDVIFTRLTRRFAEGPVDWSAEATQR